GPQEVRLLSSGRGCAVLCSPRPSEGEGLGVRGAETPPDCRAPGPRLEHAWHPRRTPVPAVRSAHGAILAPAAAGSRGSREAGLFGAPPAFGRASEPGLRSGGYPPPTSGPCPTPGQRRCQPGPPRSKARASEQPGLATVPRPIRMLVPMRRTTFWLRKEVT